MVQLGMVRNMARSSRAIWEGLLLPGKTKPWPNKNMSNTKIGPCPLLDKQQLLFATQEAHKTCVAEPYKTVQYYVNIMPYNDNDLSYICLLRDITVTPGMAPYWPSRSTNHQSLLGPDPHQPLALSHCCPRWLDALSSPWAAVAALALPSLCPYSLPLKTVPSGSVLLCSFIFSIKSLGVLSWSGLIYSLLKAFKVLVAEYNTPWGYPCGAIVTKGALVCVSEQKCCKKRKPNVHQGGLTLPARKGAVAVHTSLPGTII